MKRILGMAAVLVALAAPAFAHDPHGVTISGQATKAGGSGGAGASSGVIGGTIGKGTTAITVTSGGSSNGGVSASNTPGGSYVGQYSNAGTTSSLNSVSSGQGASLGIGGATASNVNLGHAKQGSITLPGLGF